MLETLLFHHYAHILHHLRPSKIYGGHMLLITEPISLRFKSDGYMISITIVIYKARLSYSFLKNFTF